MKNQAIAFKIPSEPGWRVIDCTMGAESVEHPGYHIFSLLIKKVGYWGMIQQDQTRGVLFDVLDVMRDYPSSKFEPLDEEGCRFQSIRRIISPLNTTDDLEMLQAVQKEAMKSHKALPLKGKDNA